MSFRQFPALGNDGNEYVIIEFHDDQRGGEDALRYELHDGQRLKRQDGRFSNEDGSLFLTPA
jgi:hypothetical protein